MRRCNRLLTGGLVAGALLASTWTSAGVPSAGADDGLQPLKPEPRVLRAVTDQPPARVVPPPVAAGKAGLQPAATATIDVTYVGFTPEAQAAFQHAVDILETVVVSSVPITVHATFSSLGGSVLGQAGPNVAYDGGSFGLDSNRWYPIPLLNALTGTDLCPPPAGPSCLDTAYDIDAEFSKDFAWYYGLDGNPPNLKYDFVSVVLHELMHGLGFVGSNYNVGPVTASRLSNPWAYDKYVETGPGVAVDSLPNNSTQLRSALLSNNLWYDGPNAVAAAGGTRPKLYAPVTWQPGSSISHLDESTYVGNDPNALMTPQIGDQQAYHDPGPIGRAILADVGWTVNQTSGQYTPGDFTGDGLTDFAVWRPSNGRWYVHGLEGFTQWGSNGDIPVPGQWDADPEADFAVFRPSNGRWYVHGQAGSVQWGANGDIPVPADYDGDGTTDIAVYRPSNGRWYLQDGPTVQWGAGSDIPVPADYDGDGTTDIAVYRPSTGRWYISGTPGSVQWGSPGDRPVPGQWDDDPAAEPAVYRLANGRWYISGDDPVQFGGALDTPVPGQYDADPEMDRVVFRTTFGRWYQDGTDGSTALGTGTDVPVNLPPALRQVPGPVSA